MAATNISFISAAPTGIGLPPAVGSRAAISESSSRHSTVTPMAARVWGMSNFLRYSSTQSMTLWNEGSGKPSQAARRVSRSSMAARLKAST